MDGHTQEFTQKSGISVPLKTKNHQSFPEPNQAVLCLNLAIAAQTLCAKKRQQPQMQKGPFYIREGLACQSVMPKGALQVWIRCERCMAKHQYVKARDKDWRSFKNLIQNN